MVKTPSHINVSVRSHDPLCPFKAFIPAKINGRPVDYAKWDSDIMDPPKPIQYYEPCQCDLIREARADERLALARLLDNPDPDMSCDCP
jgi:hypothetical protein